LERIIEFFIQLKRYTLTNLFFSWFNLAKLIIKYILFYCTKKYIYYFQIKKQYQSFRKKKLSVTTMASLLSPFHHRSTVVPPPSTTDPSPLYHCSITLPPPQSFKLIFAKIEVVFAQIEVLQKARSCVLVEFVQARDLLSSNLWSLTLWFVSFMILVFVFDLIYEF